MVSTLVLLQLYEEHGEAFISRNVTGDETWGLTHHTTDSKAELMTNPIQKTDLSPGKGMASSSLYCPSVANAPNVLQPYWLIVLSLDVPDLTASLLL